MTKQFEFRLVDGAAPQGELEVDDLIAIAQSLKEVATKLSRVETDAELSGRPSKRTQSIAKLSIGLEPGSTRVLARRVEVAPDGLDFDLGEEESFDQRFEALIESIAADKRPDWVLDPLALAAGKLRAALESAAPRVEFSVGGTSRTIFITARTHKETWLPRDATPEPTTVAFVGRLRSVNLDSHRFHVTDDLGNKVALVDVDGDAEVGPLLNRYVRVVGAPERDAKGRLSHIHEPTIESAETVPGTMGGRGVDSVEEILARVPGPIPGGIRDLTDEEAESFLTAIGF